MPQRLKPEPRNFRAEEDMGKEQRLITLEKQHSLPELAGIYLENAVGEIEKRVNPYELCFDIDGNPDFRCELDSEIGKAEYEGMKNIWKLAKSGCKYIFWISPSGGRSEYEDGRIVVGIVEDTERVKINCRGIPLLNKPDEMWVMANKIIEFGGNSIEEIKQVEDLREQALGLNFGIRNQEELWNFCESVFGVEEVWNVIRQGKDICRKKEIESVVSETLSDIKVRFGTFTESNSISAGALLENMMKYRGYLIEGGNHGGLNSDLTENSFDKLFSESEISVKPEIRDGKKFCPCGTELKDGASVCPSCGLKISYSID